MASCCALTRGKVSMSLGRFDEIDEIGLSPKFPCALLLTSCHQNIIYVYLKNSFHRSLENFRGCCNTKWQPVITKDTFVHAWKWSQCKLFGHFLHLQLQVSVRQVQFREHFSSRHGCQHIIYSIGEGDKNQQLLQH